MLPSSLPSHLSHKSSLVLIPPSSIAKPIETLRHKHDKQFHRWPPHINLVYPFLSSPSNPADFETPSLSQNIESPKIKEQADSGPLKSSSSNTPQLRDDIRSRIYSVVKDVHPFSISLHADPPGKFAHGKRSATVWLNPSDQPIKENSNMLGVHPVSGSQNPIGTLRHLQALLQSEFSECDTDNRPFTPHLSVGQAAGARGVEELSKEVKSVVEGFLHDRGDEGLAYEGDVEGHQQLPRNDNQGGLAWHIDTVFVIERKDFNDRFKIIGSIKLGET